MYYIISESSQIPYLNGIRLFSTKMFDKIPNSLVTHLIRSLSANLFFGVTRIDLAKIYNSVIRAIVYLVMLTIIYTIVLTSFDDQFNPFEVWQWQLHEINIEAKLNYFQRSRALTHVLPYIASKFSPWVLVEFPKRALQTNFGFSHVNGCVWIFQQRERWVVTAEAQLPLTTLAIYSTLFKQPPIL